MLLILMNFRYLKKMRYCNKNVLWIKIIYNVMKKILLNEKKINIKK